MDQINLIVKVLSPLTSPRDRGVKFGEILKWEEE